jgi:hypothetical protein
LTDAKELKKIYFNKNSDEVKEMFQLNDEKKKNNNLWSSYSIESNNNIESIQNVDTKETVVDEIINGLNKNIQKLEFVKVKIIITEIAKSKNKKLLRKILSPIATTFKKQPEFGMFHT